MRALSADLRHREEVVRPVTMDSLQHIKGSVGTPGPTSPGPTSPPTSPERLVSGQGGGWK